jgi:hypothetical protein
MTEYVDENLRIPKDQLLRYRAAGEYLGESFQATDDVWDIRRARFFYDQLLAGATLDPINLDNVCCGVHIYAQPVIIDGHHRLGASLIAGVRTILVHYGGRIDLRDYLTGRRRTCPAD